MQKALLGFVQVFRNVGYSIGALVIAIASYFCLVVLPQYQTIGYFWSLPIALSRKLYFVWAIGKGFFETVEVSTALYVVIISLLFGLNIAAFIYFYRSINTCFDAGSTGAGVGAGFFALLGAGCASCGTFIATYVLGLLGAQGLLLWLPLGGMEFAIIGLLGLAFSLYSICKKIAE